MTVATQPTTRIDRRLDERRDCLRGLTRWLESARRMLELDALALADPTGCLVVGAGSAQRCEELAAFAPFSSGAEKESGPAITALAAGAAWLCAPGQSVRADDWQNVAAGCLRILGWSEPRWAPAMR
jgi:hypothetical protein